MELPKVIGKIDLSNLSLELPMRKPTLTCDDCGAYCDDSFGDSRTIITTIYADKSSSVRRVCNCCADDNFGHHEPKSIFE